MEYRTIQKTGQKVSVISLGCEGLIDKDQKEFTAMIDYAQEKGINFLDMYTPNPKFRAHLKKALEGRRDQFILQGHIGSIWIHGDYLRTRQLKQVKQGFEDLLHELGTDYLDIGMIHYVDAQEDLEKVFHSELYTYVCSLKEQGKIKAIGMSSHNPLVALEAVKNDWIDVLMFSINPAYDMIEPSEDVDDLFKADTYNKNILSLDPYREELYALCEQKGIAIDVMKAFGGGDLLVKEYSPFNQAFSEAMCLNYALSRPGVVAVMAGAHSIKQIETLVQALYASEEEKEYANVLSSLKKVDAQGHCVYCSHCQPCSASIQIFQVNKFLALAKNKPEIPETVREHYASLAHHASECIACGACLSRCPFHVEIIKQMEEAKELFGY